MLVIDFKILYGTIFKTITNFFPVSFKIVRSSPFDYLPAEDFFHGSVAADPSIIHIRINYPALFIDYHKPSVGGFNDCPVSFFTFAQSIFRQFAFRDIFNQQYASDRLVLIANRAPIDSDESTTSIYRVERSFQLDVLPFLKIIQVRHQPGPLYSRDLPDIRSQCPRLAFISRKSDDLFQLRILIKNSHLVIQPDDPDGCVSQYSVVELQQRPVFFLRSLQCFLRLLALL